MEPYTLKYIKVICIDGECDIKSIAIVEYSSPIEINIEFNKMNLQMTKIIESGLETFKQNSVDIYMDCPSRERAGWLCDSFFMARTEFCLTGESVIERNFLENYMLPEKFDFIPDGMLPMCYPADHYDGNFIPNWSLWFALQIKEYHDRSGDDELIKKLKSKMDKLLQYFIKYENELELLENLEGWVFVEWSHANDLTDGINFPSNMLYAGALESLGILYSDQNLVDKACRIRKVILGLSNSKTLFFDRAIRKNGVIEVINESTEVCQYYAFFFKVATPITHPKLWRILVNEFGPKRKNSNNYPQVAFANAFFGLYLRLDILSTYGLHGKSICEIEEYFLAMADLTGTLWEHDSPLASCNHGFASYILFIISKQ
jgi:alpha-L-rhamnosidase